MSEWNGSPLFQFAEFVLASGKKSKFKLECDAISPEEWHSLGRIVRPILPPYGRVVSVPRGGDAWASILEHYRVPGEHRVLIVDDVWTTGISMGLVVNRTMIHTPINEDFLWHGVVLFARGPVPKNVTALFHLNENLQ
jgi:hypothetical protein